MRVVRKSSVACVAGLIIPLVLICFTRASYADEGVAQPSQEAAKEHFTAGNRLYRIREFEKAIEEYKAGALIEDVPVFYYNLGQCYRQQGKYQDAIWHYQRFLDRADPPPHIRRAVEDFITQMRSEMDRKAMTQAPTEPVQDERGSLRTAVPVVPDDSGVTSHQPLGEAEAWYADRLAWGLTGSGALASGIAAAFFLSAAGIDNDANIEPRQELKKQLHDQAADRRLVGTVVAIAGGAALVTGIVKLALVPEGKPAATSAGLDVGVSPSGVMVMGRF